MSNKKLVINNLDFAKKGQSLSGALSLREMPRLCEWLEDLGALSQAQLQHLARSQEDVGEDVLNYELSGSADAGGQHFLHLQLNFAMDLVCQRCLKPMQKALDITYDYLITPMSDEDLLSAEEDVEEGYDVIAQNKAMDAQAMMVDEVIAAIPYAPMHEQLCEALKVESGEKANPFAVLKGLKKDLS